MTLGNQVEWALHCMSILAGMPPDAMVPAKVLAEFHGVPKEYLSKALQALSNAGLVETTLGPKGGYRLAKPASAISFLDIVEAVEGRKKTFQCHEIRRENPCIPKKSAAYSDICGIAAVMHQADQAWRFVLKQKKLSETVKEVAEVLGPENLKKTAAWFAEKI
ncbi:MAG: Rrf2 family transcriptional regulator [Bacteriovoracia bacterium]